MIRRMARRGAGVGMLAVLARCAAIAATLAVPGVSPASQSLPSADFAFDGVMTQGGIVVGTAPAGTTALRFDGIEIPVAADGRFLIAFDRDAGPRAELTATRADGATITHTLAIAPRAWQIERLNTVARFPRPSVEFARQRPAELAQIAAARQAGSDAQGWRQRFIWPAVGRISGRFGAQRVYRGEAGAYHSGVDVARPEGAPVVAPADGVVILAADRPFTLEGNLLMIDHGMGLNSAFLHLSRIDVRVGQHVRQGEPIGRVGHTGRASGPHLHWGMKWRQSRIDPLLLAGTMPSQN